MPWIVFPPKPVAWGTWKTSHGGTGTWELSPARIILPSPLLAANKTAYGSQRDSARRQGGSKVFTEMEGGCRWGCTKTVALTKIQRGRIMSFRPDGLAVSSPAAAVLGKAPMALEDKLCKGWHLWRAPLSSFAPFAAPLGHRLMLLPPPSLSHPGRALGRLEAPSGDCLNVVLSRHRPRDPDA